VNSQRAYLLHTLDAIDAVMEYTQDARDVFFADRKTQDAVIRRRPGRRDRSGTR
jgi:uncharacterized protein with HEPN domain